MVTQRTVFCHVINLPFFYKTPLCLPLDAHNLIYPQGTCSCQSIVRNSQGQHAACKPTRVPLETTCVFAAFLSTDLAAASPQHRSQDTLYQSLWVGTVTLFSISALRYKLNPVQIFLLLTYVSLTTHNYMCHFSLSLSDLS